MHSLNSDAAHGRVYFPSAAVFGLPPLKVTVCSIPLKVDERGNRGTQRGDRSGVVLEGRPSAAIVLYRRRDSTSQRFKTRYE